MLYAAPRQHGFYSTNQLLSVSVGSYSSTAVALSAGWSQHSYSFTVGSAGNQTLFIIANNPTNTDSAIALTDVVVTYTGPTN
jgi:hypothetical protein